MLNSGCGEGFFFGKVFTELVWHNKIYVENANVSLFSVFIFTISDTLQS